MYWVSKWVDYSDKYGFGYALCDESIGVVFNDLTKLLLLSDGRYYSENSILQMHCTTYDSYDQDPYCLIILKETTGY